jgi:eukaryotic-like serine/threonine-protein kinase
MSEGAAHRLLGLTLAPDWKVVRKLDLGDDRTTTEFSVGYEVENAKGERAFCKALDWSSALDSEDFEEEMRRHTQAFLFERDLLDHCRELKMRRVVHAIGSGNVRVEGGSPPRVSYLLFDIADGDTRDILDQTEIEDFPVSLALAHHCAVALGQLHRARVTHQDVKPANLLGWREVAGWSGKLADLGRAFCESMTAPHDGECCPGDTIWAPPELLYAWPNELSRGHWERQLADLYSLGAFICNAFARIPFNAILAIELEREHLWNNWQGGYVAAKSLLVDAHQSAITRMATTIPEPIRDEIVELVSDMCHPILEQRGALARRGGSRSAFVLERYISVLDRLSSKHPVLPSMAPLAVLTKASDSI